MSITNLQSPATFSERFAQYLLYPGNAVCDALEIHDPDSRMLLRMFVNVGLYAKLTMLIVYFFA